MISYPLQELEDISRSLQELISEQRSSHYRAIVPGVAHEERGDIIFQASKDLMNKAGSDLLPRLNKALGEIEALLDEENAAIVKRITPLLSEVRRLAEDPVNPIGYSELSSKLMRLSGHLLARIVAKPKIFVGHSYEKRIEIIVDKFIRLFQLEGLECFTGKPAKAMEIDDKVEKLITESDGVIIIFSKDKELRDSHYWTTSSWLKSEVTCAKTQKKPFLMFYEKWIDPDERKGLHGEVEYIEFDAEGLDDTFLKAIPYLRDFKQRILSKNEPPDS